ncbi:MAG TPA: YcdB/YcdC domain-containing protein, partial [Symbiobacteriaceae bacterium]|nr:YcdB/YcdC domain-containing protein [Symbiobacteriaceae bacterium]
MSRPVWAAGLLVLVLAMPAQAASGLKPMMPTTPPAPTAPVATIAEGTAIQVARSLFPAELVQAKPNVELSPHYSGHAVWDISWEGDGMIFVSVDARDGQVVSVNRWKNGPTLPSTTRLTQAEAEAKAAGWLAKLAPGAQSALVAAKSPFADWYDPSAYTFGYNWQAMGYPVPNAGAYLRIEDATGELLGWHLNRPEGKMVLPPAILAESEARAAFAKLPLTLSYTRAYWKDESYHTKPSSSSPMLLAYLPPQELALSQSGSWIGPDGQPLPDVTIPTWKQVPPPIVPYKPPTEPLSKAESLMIAQKASGRTGEPDLVSLSRWDGQLTYNFGWVDWSKPEGNELNVSVDAVRGLVQEIWSGKEFSEGPATLTPAEAQQIAVDFMVTYRPDLAGVLYYPAANLVNGLGSYIFRFNLQHEGIMVQDYSAELWINGATGQVVTFWGPHQMLELDLPKPEGILPPGPLMAKLVEVAGLELGWVQVQPAGEEPFLQLVWHLGQSVPVSLIEAQTGIFRDEEGTDVLKFRLPPTDVAGHWAEHEILALFDQRIVTVESGKFMPEQAMTEAEAAAWLARLNYTGPRPFATEVPAVGKDGAEVAPGEPNPATPITREAFVRQVVVALGYEKIAGMKNQIWMDFHDQAQIEPGARNAVAVLNGLGVIRGTPEGYFLPKKS